MRSQATRLELIEVAQGQRPADLFIEGGNIINVYSGEFIEGNVAVYKGRIAYVGDSKGAIGETTQVIDAEGKFICPGFIEAHAHPWVMYNPISFTAKVLSLGTTTVVNDNLFFYLYMGAQGFKEMMNDLAECPGNNFWLARLVSQADYSGEKEWFNQQDICSLLEHEKVVGTAEVTRWPLLYHGDPELLEMIEYAKQLGKVSDGHTAGCSYDKLNSIVAAGISACHEAITAQESLDRLRLGMWTTLRNSSLRPDLPELIKLVTEGQVNTSRIIMTTDGPHPAFIEEEGFVDGLVRKAVQHGIPPIKAIQMVTINAATYLHMDDQIGGIAPGRRADLLIMPNLTDFRAEVVVSGGQIVAIDGILQVPLPEINWDKYMVKKSFDIPKSMLMDSNLYQYPLASSVEAVPVIQFKSTVITKKKEIRLPAFNGYADISGTNGLVYAALIDREGGWISRGLLENFCPRLEGMASTYNTTTQLLTIGNNPDAMAMAAARVYEMGGGIAISEGGKIMLEIPLPVTGMMTSDPNFGIAVEYQDRLLTALQERGYPFHDILYTLLFLTCDFLPGLRLVPFGLYDVKEGRVVKSSQQLVKSNVRVGP